MKLADLRRALRAADPGAVLVAPHVIERVIRETSPRLSLIWEVPHRKCYIVDRHLLFRHVEQDELDLESDQLLPATVILLARPSPESLNTLGRDAILSRYWRLLFHAAVHRAIETSWTEGGLAESELRERIEGIGASAFAEAKQVLIQDNMLLPSTSDRAAFIEFAAVYLELYYFAQPLISVYFPALPAMEQVSKVLSRDLNAAALFTSTRLKDAPDPPKTIDPPDESQDYFHRLQREARRATAAGNTVKAAILHTRAARIAPTELTRRSQEAARRDLERLVGRMRPALALSQSEAEEWLQELPAVLDKADQGRHPPEAALLDDLQRACEAHERDIFTLDVIEWLLTAGHRPIRRALPSQRFVRLTRHLRAASRRLTSARLTDAERRHLGQLMQSALASNEIRLRERFRPILTDALVDAGLQPQNPGESVQLAKIVEELIDLISERGFFNFADLRDAISRNQLKLADLSGPQEYMRGDPLIRLDRRLATLLDGVYRRSDFYVRWLQKLTALFFGTEPGRWLATNVALPIGGSFVIVELVEKLLYLFKIGSMDLVVYWSSVAALAGFFLGLSRSRRVRAATKRVARYTGNSIVRLAQLPGWAWRTPWIRAVFQTWAWQVGVGWFLKPLLLTGLVLFALPELVQSWPALAVTFVAVSLLVNSRAGAGAQLALFSTFAGLYQLVSAGLIPGLIRWIVGFFKRTVGLVDYVLFTVEEWLRSRTGENMLTLTARATAGVLWYPIGYASRFALVVLVEPMLNPVKLPIAVAAGKAFAVPLAALSIQSIKALMPITGEAIAIIVVGVVVFHLPNGVAFLVWELKENWNLYRANRGDGMSAESIGPHGETVHGLLQPGFHSGTVPKLYAQLRKLIKRPGSREEWRAIRACQEQLQEVIEGAKRFVEREFVCLVNRSPDFQERPIALHKIELCTGQIRVELSRFGSDQRAMLVWELRGRWLVAHWEQAGWLRELNNSTSWPMTLALVRLYRLAGVSVVAEQMQARMPRDLQPLEVVPLGVQAGPYLYDLSDPQEKARPRSPDGWRWVVGPEIDMTKIRFGTTGPTWDEWCQAWQETLDGRPGIAMLMGTADHLLPTRSQEIWSAMPQSAAELQPLDATHR